MTNLLSNNKSSLKEITYNNNKTKQNVFKDVFSYFFFYLLQFAIDYNAIEKQRS